MKSNSQARIAAQISLQRVNISSDTSYELGRDGVRGAKDYVDRV